MCLCSPVAVWFVGAAPVEAGWRDSVWADVADVVDGDVCSDSVAVALACDVVWVAVSALSYFAVAFVVEVVDFAVAWMLAMRWVDVAVADSDIVIGFAVFEAGIVVDSVVFADSVVIVDSVVFVVYSEVVFAAAAAAVETVVDFGDVDHQWVQPSVVWEGFALDVQLGHRAFVVEPLHT